MPRPSSIAASPTSFASSVSGACNGPAPFASRGQIGTSAHVVVACPACGCAVGSATYAATVTPYKSADCTSGVLANIPPDGSCNPLGGGNNAASFLHVPNVPDASCPALGGGTGAIGFSPSITVCCLP